MKLTFSSKKAIYKIYSDNLFTSAPLLEMLIANKIQYTDTVQQN